MTQVDVDTYYEWRPSKLQVVFLVTVTITIKVYGCQDLFANGTMQLRNSNDRYAVSAVKAISS